MMRKQTREVKQISDCNHDCGSCEKNCSDRNDLAAPQNERSRVKKVIGVVSGKGGVGKSGVTSMLAVAANRAGNKTAIMDADITGPSIPRAFGLTEKAKGDEKFIDPVYSKNDIGVMSMNLLLEEEGQPVVWRGPVLAGAVKQFWSDVVWGDIDVMVIDCPPGTGDVPLTLFQSIPLDGIVVVTSPQELVSMIVEKAVNMAHLMKIPVLGVVENMSYVKGPDCGKEIKVFGESNVDKVAKDHGLKVLSKIPLDPKLSALSDKGMMELFENDYITPVADIVEALPVKENK